MTIQFVAGQISADGKMVRRAKGFASDIGGAIRSSFRLLQLFVFAGGQYGNGDAG